MVLLGRVLARFLQLVHNDGIGDGLQSNAVHVLQADIDLLGNRPPHLAQVLCGHLRVFGKKLAIVKEQKKSDG